MDLGQGADSVEDEVASRSKSENLLLILKLLAEVKETYVL